MDLLIPYVVAPLVLIALCVGAGLLLASTQPRLRFDAATAPTGLALVVVVGTVMTAPAATTRYTTPVICAIAIAGAVAALLRGRTRLREGWRKVTGWPAATAAASFALFAAPVALSGRPSWAGWIKLDDSATWLGFTDALMSTGKVPPATVTSTFERNIDIYFAAGDAGWVAGYPTGAFPPLGVLAQLTGSDVAWLLHPYMAALGALLALAIYAILTPLVRSRALRALASVVSAQAATLVAYVLWGGLKEVLVPVLVAVLALTSVAASRRGSTWRGLIPPAVAAASLFAVLDSAGMGYVLPIVGAAVLIGWTRRRPRSGAIATSAAISATVTGLVLFAAGIVPESLTLVPTFGDIGNLAAPLNPFQTVGVWPAADFRFGPELPVLTALLIAITIAAAVVGGIGAIRHRSWSLPLFAASALAVVAYATLSGDAWLAGKAMAVASPAVIAAALAGALLLTQPQAGQHEGAVPGRGLSLVGKGAMVLIIVGVAWSNALAFKGVSLAPVAPHAELEAIGREFDGQGPALMTDYSVFGGRHFLRTLDTEVASELRVNQIPLRDGSIGEKGQSFDVSAFPPSTLEPYPLLVLRRSPTGARPPLNYELVRPGAYYDVWRRIPGSASITADVPLAGTFAVPEVDSCAAITALSTQVREGGTLVGSVRPDVVTIPLGQGDLPPGWTATDDGASIVASGAGSVTAPFAVQDDGMVEVWIAGSYPGVLTVSIDGEPVETGLSNLEFDDRNVTPIGTLPLTAGQHELTITHATPWWRPGTDPGPFTFGPAFVTPSPRTTQLVEVPARRAAELCGLDLEWVATATPPVRLTRRLSRSPTSGSHGPVRGRVEGHRHSEGHERHDRDGAQDPVGRDQYDDPGHRSPDGPCPVHDQVRQALHRRPLGWGHLVGDHRRAGDQGARPAEAEQEQPDAQHRHVVARREARHHAADREDRDARHDHGDPAEAVNAPAHDRRQGVHPRDMDADDQADELQGHVDVRHVHGRHDHHHDHHHVADRDRRDAQERTGAPAQVLDPVAQSWPDDVLPATLAVGDRGQVGVGPQEEQEHDGRQRQAAGGHHVGTGQLGQAQGHPQGTGHVQQVRPEDGADGRRPHHPRQRASPVLLGCQVGRRVPGLVPGGRCHPDEEAADEDQRQVAQHRRDDDDDGPEGAEPVAGRQGETAPAAQRDAREREGQHRCPEDPGRLGQPRGCLGVGDGRGDQGAGRH